VNEVRVCVKHGCRLLIIHEFNQYDVKLYNLNPGEGENFVQYIDTFLKLKTEDSGNLGWVQWPEDE
jgi:hypothetical protein